MYDSIVKEVKRIGLIKKLNKKQKEIKKLIEHNSVFFKELYHGVNNPLLGICSIDNKSILYKDISGVITLSQYNKLCATDDVIPVIKPMLPVSMDEINTHHLSLFLDKDSDISVCYIPDNKKSRFFIVISDMYSQCEPLVVIKGGKRYYSDKIKTPCLNLVNKLKDNMATLHKSQRLSGVILDVYFVGGVFYDVIDILPINHFSVNSGYTQGQRISLLRSLDLDSLYRPSDVKKVILKQNKATYRSGKCWTWLECSRTVLDNRGTKYDSTNE